MFDVPGVIVADREEVHQIICKRNQPLQVATVPYPQRSRLLSREQFKNMTLDELDMEISRLIGQNFADLAMIKAAENSPSPPPAAAIAYETDQAHITMIHRVIGDDGKRVIGTIMVQFKPALVAQALQDISLPHGYVELRQQKSSGGFTTLAATGEPSAKNANPVWTRPIEATRWQLAYWAGSQATTLPITLLTGSKEHPSDCEMSV